MKIMIVALATVIAGAGVAAHAQTKITGAGSAFAAPIYAKWGDAASPTIGVKLNYQAIGSGAGSTRSTAVRLISAPPTCPLPAFVRRPAAAALHRPNDSGPP